MREFINDLLSGWGLTPSVTLTNVILVAILLVLAVVIYYALQILITPWLRKIMQKSKIGFWNVLGESKIFPNIAMLVMTLILQGLTSAWLVRDNFRDGLISILQIIGLVFLLISLYSVLDVITTLVFRSNKAKNFPIRGITQTVKLLLAISIGLMIVSILIGKSPLILLSGLGAMTAILMLVFKDPIMGLVSGIQLSANHMLYVGDWLEMPKYNADGDVIDIGLTTVKVRNFDNTITMVPTSALITDSFKNWRGMTELGGRRIKRSLNIDMTTVRFLTDEEIKEFEAVKVLYEYLTKKQEEIGTWNKENNVDMNNLFNGRRLTNLGTFRLYVYHYLKNNPNIHQGMSLLVRQMEPTEKGIPIELYCFTNTTVWEEYENIQSDIFDHLLAVANLFGLRVHQSVSGSDVSIAAQQMARELKAELMKSVDSAASSGGSSASKGDAGGGSQASASGSSASV